MRETLAAIAFTIVLLATAARADEPSPFKSVACEGTYPGHLQGVCTNERDAIYWSFTEALVKTDTSGKLLNKLTVPYHHGDLCHHDGKIYVAVNLGKFNEPAGKADSWVYVYQATDLAFVAKYPVPDVVHGAGGMAWHDGRFVVIGGLPPGVDENYAYEYDEQFHLLKRHVIASAYTLMGIQTAAFVDGFWWFGCYGKPQVLLKVGPDFKFIARYEFDASLGIVGVGGRTVLVGRGTTKDKQSTGRLLLADIDEKRGIVLRDPPAKK